MLFSLFALLLRPLAKKYHVKEIYLFGSYARGEADAQSDLDFLIFGGDGFRLTEILISLMRQSHPLIVSSFIRDLVLDQLEEDGELEESRILKALELSYKEVYDLEEML
ncbi:MAG: hypothetical protein EGQ71_07840 [Dialister sp.]|nr:hypothetical protein [Dialister sp.]